jgi:sulfate transport system substrate-binding protein
MSPLILLLACGQNERSSSGPEGPTRTLTLAAYAAARDAYGGALLPAFAERWRARTGEVLVFAESYQASGAQARAVRDGLEADVVALSLDPDVALLAETGLVTHDWRAGPTRGIASESLVVIAVRPGNPHAIRSWTDLGRPELELLTPNVRTSGGAMWNVLAVWGAACRAGQDGTAALSGVLSRVSVMDKSGRDSLVTFERGVGDAAITYEHEVLVARRAGKAMDYVIPPSTLRIESPIAVVDVYAERHGNAEVARAFVEFVLGDEGQRLLVETGLRSTRILDGLPEPADLFTVADLGGWAEVQAAVFAKDAAYDRALADAQPR